MSDLDSLIQEFLAESRENLDRFDHDLVALEKTPQDRQRLASVFRTIHTIKGTSGFFGFTRLGAVTHAGENLLSRLREGELILGPEITTALLALVDAVRRMLDSIERTGQEGNTDDSVLLAQLTRLVEAPPRRTARCALSNSGRASPAEPGPRAEPGGGQPAGRHPSR
jgi:two-component system chemotaxis sensor kinase CheA